jgi:hypothetical protein
MAGGRASLTYVTTLIAGPAGHQDLLDNAILL